METPFKQPGLPFIGRTLPMVQGHTQNILIATSFITSWTVRGV